MSVNRGFHSAAITIVVVTGLLAVSTLRGQEAPALHATLRGLDEETRLTIFDRTGSYFGRLTEHGILQRYNPRSDAEYDIDLVSFSFLLSEEYEWYRRPSGVRFWTGSVNHLGLIQAAELNATVALGSRWSARAQLTQQHNFHARRALAQLALRRELAGGKARAFVAGTLKEEKSDADVEAGVTLLGPGGEVTVAVASLDAFSDFIQQELGVTDLTDSVLDYTTHPFSARTAFDLSLTPTLRVEGYALLMAPARFTVGKGDGVAEYLAVDEAFGYAGGLLEWSPNPRTAVGAIATWVRAHRDGRQLDSGIAADNFEHLERTARLGVYAMRSLGRAFTLEAWLTRLWRSEQRLPRGPSAALSVIHDEAQWVGRADVRYRSRSGFHLDLGSDLLARRTRNTGAQTAFGFPTDLHARLRLDLGWTLQERATFTVGTNADLDQDNQSATGWFDGGHGRFALYW